MINNFLIISCIGKDDKLGLRINKDFFILDLDKNNNNNYLGSRIYNFLKTHKVELDENFAIIVNQGPGSFSSIRIALAVAKGIEISKNVLLYGYKNSDLGKFDLKNIEQLLNENLTEKNLIKPVYLS
tara:strand:- start:233 stop:613 length:381 start_codon:yes stop_codon:yes gene_type:complete